jgi:hypothetical protein
MIFKFTEEAIRVRKSKIVMLLCLLYAYIFGSFYIRFYPNFFLLVTEHFLGLWKCFAIFAIIGLFLFFQGKTVLKRMRSYHLELTQDTLTFITNFPPVTIPLASIKRVNLYEQPAKIILKANKNLYVICGYEKMDEIIEAIKTKVEPAIIKKKARLLNWDRSSTIWINGLVIWVLSLVFMKLILLYPEMARRLLFLWPLCAGICFLLIPVNMRGKSSKVKGWLFIAVGLLLFIVSILKILAGK